MRLFATLVVVLAIGVTAAPGSGGSNNGNNGNGGSNDGNNPGVTPTTRSQWGPLLTGFTPYSWWKLNATKPNGNSWQDVIPINGTAANIRPCGLWFDDVNSATCCADTNSTSYGHCHSSTIHNCPGEYVSSTCNTGTNEDEAGEGASCPFYTRTTTTFPDYPTLANGTRIYPLCRPVSPNCMSDVGVDKHCWGILTCYTSPKPNSTHYPVPCNNVYSDHGKFTYQSGSFCFQDGTSNTNTKWCGYMPCASEPTPVPGTAGARNPNGNGDKCMACPLYRIDPHSNICCPVNYNPFTETCDFTSPTAPATAAPTSPATSPPTPPATLPPIPPATSPPTDPTSPTAPSGTLPPGGASGDPQFGGFHGQSFQFHGLADEVFNLISSPALQLNGHFVYLSSGSCTYNYTECWTHPGTYIDQLGFAFQDRQVTVIAGPHGIGLHLAINGDAITRPGTYAFAQANGADVSITLKHHNVVIIATSEFVFTVYNSDHFFNIETTLLDRRLLRVGAPRHTITDRVLCAKEEHVDQSKFAADRNATQAEHQHGAVEAVLQKKYGGMQVPLHGLIGQTWRNAVVCGKHWIGAVTDYVASDLFASDYFFNFYTTD